MFKIIGSDILAYRKVIEDRKNDLPIWERKVLTCEEAAAYSGIGIARLRKLALKKGCTFSMKNGTQVFIVREKFDEYIDKAREV